MSFLPDDYADAKKAVSKSGGDYLKFQDGETKFRILDKPIVGYIAWAERKPYRIRTTETFSEKFPDVTLDADNKTKIFWAMPVYNVNTEEIQLLEIDKATVLSAIEGLATDADWGDPTGYDIKVIKAGKGKDTTYTTTPGKASPIDPQILKDLKDMGMNISALYDGGNPFKSDNGAEEASEEDLPFN